MSPVPASGEHGTHPTLISENSELAARIVSVVRSRRLARRYDSAAAWGRAAAAFSTTNPSDRLWDPALEHELDEVSRATMGESPTHRRSSAPRRVLHVLSEAHLIGGHVRMAMRWATLDRSSHSSFIVTRPGMGLKDLEQTAQRGGGRADVLSGQSLIARARALRRRASEADIVVCHVHSDDPVPALAFGGNYRGAPVVLVNHADHVYWLSAGNVTTVANLRATGASFTVAARGFDPADCFYLPIPIADTPRRQLREEAKATLGIDPRSVVALTLGRGTKYGQSLHHPGFVDVVTPALLQSPDAILLAVGPDPEEPAWAELVRTLGPERVRVPGLSRDPQPFLDAADVYLDSFPFASNTSMLEAAARGTAVVSGRFWNGMRTLLSSEGILPQSVMTANTLDGYRNVVARLLASEEEEERRRWGRQAAAEVLSHHAEQVWPEHLTGLYRHVEDSPAGIRRNGPVTFSPEELRYYFIALAGIESANPLLWTLLTIISNLDARDRLGVQLRTAAVRGLQRLSSAGPGGGPVGASILVPRRPAGRAS